MYFDNAIYNVQYISLHEYVMRSRWRREWRLLTSPPQGVRPAFVNPIPNTSRTSYLFIYFQPHSHIRDSSSVMSCVASSSVHVFILYLTRRAFHNNYACVHLDPPPFFRAHSCPSPSVSFHLYPYKIMPRQFLILFCSFILAYPHCKSKSICRDLKIVEHVQIIDEMNRPLG